MRYIFRCQKCGIVELELPMMAERPIVHECGEPMQRVWNTSNIIYRSSGFYTVDKRLKPVDPLDYDRTVHSPEDLKR